MQKIKSEETKAKISAAKRGCSRPEGAGIPKIKLEVIDVETGMKTIYPSISAAAEALGVFSGSIRTYFSRNTQKPYKGRYLMKKVT